MLNQSCPHTSHFSQAPKSGATPSQNITARSNQGSGKSTLAIPARPQAFRGSKCCYANVGYC